MTTKDTGGSAWQPIETAPKDGRYVLLVHQSSGGRPYAGMWCHDDKQWADERGCIRVPTHWMPLPAPPLAKAGGEQSAEWLEIPAFLRRGND